MKLLDDTGFFDHDDVLTTSPAFQLFGSGRRQVKAATLLAMLDAGWPMDATEVSPVSMGGRSILLQYLGTFDTWLQTTEHLSAPVEQSQEQEDAIPTGSHGRTFMNLAKERRTQERSVAYRLLEMGADPWAKDVEGRDGLDQAMALGWLGLVDRLLQRPDAPPVVDLAQRTLWVPHVLDPDPKRAGGYYAARGLELPWVHAAVAHAQHPLIQRLLDHGFPIDQGDAMGRSPLFYASFNATAGLLFARGANPLHQDLMGQTAGQVWPALVEKPAEKPVMQAAFKAALETAVRLHATDHPGIPGVMAEQQARTLFTMTVNDPKVSVVKFMRENGLDANLRQPADGTAPGRSLLAHIALHGVGNVQRSRAVADHVFTRVEDPWYESLPGVPDVWLALLATVDHTASGGVEFPGNVWSAMKQRYPMGSPDGVARFLDDGLRLMQRSLDRDPALNALTQARNPLDTRKLWAAVLNTLIDRVPVQERSGSALQAGLASLNDQRQVRAWAWLDRLATAYDTNLEPVFGVERVAQALGDLTLPRDGWDSQGRPQGPTLPMVPPDGLAINALLGMVGVPNKDRTTMAGLIPGAPFTTWQPSVMGHKLLRQALLDGAAVDTSLPGFEQRFARLQKHQPFLAQMIEQQVLRQAADSSRTPEVGTEPGSRRRL